MNGFSEKILAWVEWVDENVRPEEGLYPPVSTMKVSGLWEDDAYEHGNSMFWNKTSEGDDYRDGALSAFMRCISASPNSFAVRFTAIHFYWLAAKTAKSYDPIEFPGVDGDIAAELCEDDLRLVIRSLGAQDCPRDWPFLVWELSNSFLISDFARAMKLLEVAEDANIRPELNYPLLRAQYRMLAIREPQLNRMMGSILGSDIDWSLKLAFWVPPRLFSDPPDTHPVTFNQLANALLLYIGMAHVDPDVQLQDWKLEYARSAALEIETGLEAFQEAPRCYRALLGRAFFLCGRFHDSAVEYEKLLVGTQTREGDCGRWGLFSSAILALRRASEIDRAKDMLRRQISEFPQKPKLHISLAELEAQQGNYCEAAEEIRAELEVNPSADTDWRLSAVLGLAATASNVQTIEEVLRRDSSTGQGIDSLLRDYWSLYGVMREDARRSWQTGTHLLNFSQTAGPLRTQLMVPAAFSFITAVEVELKCRLLVPLQAQFRANQELFQLAQSVDDVFWRFITANGPLTFGQACYALRSSAESTSRLMQAVRRWVNERYPQFYACLSHAQVINDHRVNVRHRATVEQVGELVTSCRTLLKALHPEAR